MDGLENERIRQKRSINRSPFDSRVDKIGLQSRVISQPRCRTKLRGIFKHAQRQSRDGRFFLFVGGYDQLVGNQTALLSACGVVILSEFLSPNFDLSSSTVRNVLRGWIAHGDVAAVWLTQPLTSSGAASLLVSTRNSSTILSVRLSSVAPTTPLASSKDRWICVHLASRSGNVLCFSPSMFRCTGSWLDAVTTLVRSDPFLAKRIDNSVSVVQIVFFFTEHIHSLHATDS